MSNRQWRIGELADATGISVRALRHYDELGLLLPADRTAAGYRLYSEADVRRLYRILALRRLGLSLREVGALLDAGAPTFEQIVGRHLAHIDDQLTALERLRARVARVADAIADDHGASSDQLLDAMEGMTMTIELTRIYTGRGDDGFTDLGDGTRVAKSDPRLTPDLEELASQLGFALALAGPGEAHARLLRRVQNDLFDLGADLAGAGAEQPRNRVTAAYVAALEEACIELNGNLEPLSSFLLPGGTAVAAQLHVCRTTCRRAEREAAGLADANPQVLRYLNRLSDLLFILARAVSDAPEHLWQPGGEHKSNAAESPRQDRP